MRRQLFGASAALLALSCGGETAGQRDQWLVVVSTDAPVPELGDRLLVEISGEDGVPQCSDCRRLLSVSTGFPVSFGIQPPRGPGRTFVRTRLWRAEYAGSDGLPKGPAVIDALGELPLAAALTTVHVHLSLGCFGVPADPAAHTTCDPTTATPAPAPVLFAPPDPLPEPGSSPVARAASCPDDVQEGMVCVPGGVFLLGTPRYFDFGADLRPEPERLVALPTFALDRDEVTVGEVRRLVEQELVIQPSEWSSDPNNARNACTYDNQDHGGGDTLPVNCIHVSDAEAVCRARGARLPTEAEWEYAAGNTSAETTYPWGADPDVCAHARVGRGRAVLAEEYSCLETGERWGASAEGNAGDVTALGIRNLAGNVAEWMADDFEPYTGPCWSGSGVLEAPLCRTGVPEAKRSLRGASWSEPPAFAGATRRDAANVTGRGPFVGFRCARSLDP